MRNYNLECQDNAARKYAYDFDSIVRRYMLETLKPYFNCHGATLEMGCYKGDMTEQILNYLPTITVIEASSDLALTVQQRFPGKVTVITSTFETAQIEEKFDNIFIVHTLEHLDDPVTILKKIRDWLTPTGLLFVAVPNANALSRQLAVKMGLIEYNAAVTPGEAEHGHRRTYSMDVLLGQLRCAGYRAVDYGGILVKPFANFQFDQAIAQGILNEAYLEACNELAKTYPELSASLFAVCTNAE